MYFTPSPPCINAFLCVFTPFPHVFTPFGGALMAKKTGGALIRAGALNRTNTVYTGPSDWSRGDDVASLDQSYRPVYI
jgi:hypothetical protein